MFLKRRGSLRSSSLSVCTASRRAVYACRSSLTMSCKGRSLFCWYVISLRSSSDRFQRSEPASMCVRRTGAISLSPHVTWAITSFTDHLPAAPGLCICSSSIWASSASHVARVSVSVLSNVALSISSSFCPLSPQLLLCFSAFHSHFRASICQAASPHFLVAEQTTHHCCS